MKRLTWSLSVSWWLPTSAKLSSATAEIGGGNSHKRGRSDNRTPQPQPSTPSTRSTQHPRKARIKLLLLYNQESVPSIIMGKVHGSLARAGMTLFLPPRNYWLLTHLRQARSSPRRPRLLTLLLLRNFGDINQNRLTNKKSRRRPRAAPARGSSIPADLWTSPWLVASARYRTTVTPCNTSLAWKLTLCRWTRTRLLKIVTPAAR
jgi:hypothetical protein